MKSLVLAFTLFSFTMILGISSLSAQEVIENSIPSKEEQKAAIKLLKAKENLEKSKIKLIKLEEAYDKKQQRFTKKNSQGKLSPNDVDKETTAIEALEKKIEKIKEKIEDLELFIQEND